MYHPCATNILVKKSIRRPAVPNHLYGTYGVDLSNQAWYCYVPISSNPPRISNFCLPLSHEMGNIHVAASKFARSRLRKGSAQAPLNPSLQD